jgi:hypothetical protein
VEEEAVVVIMAVVAAKEEAIRIYSSKSLILFRN